MTPKGGRAQWGLNLVHVSRLRNGGCKARPLRVVFARGWYHVVNRGHRRERIFLTDEDRRAFLGRLSALPKRFGVEVHAFGLMDSHYHLQFRPLAGLGRPAV